MSTTTVTTTETTVLVQLSDIGVQGASGIGYTGITSTSTITLGTGLKTFTLVSGYAGAFLTGMRVRAIHSDTPTYYMEGTANYVGGGTIIVTVDKFNGTGSHNNWNFAVSGETGVTSLIASSPLTGGTVTSTGTIGLNQSLLSLTRSQISDFSGGTVTSAGTAQQAGTAVYSTVSGTATYSTLAGTAVYGTNSGTAVYSTLSGTAVGLSGSITRSQVSDYATGTVANISGTVAQSQVTSLVSDLANRAVLNAANTFTVGGQIVASTSDTVMPLVLRRASSTATASILEFQTSTGTAIASVDASARGNFPAVSAGASTDLGYATLSVTPTSTATVGAVIRGASGQTANLFSGQRSDTTEVMRIRNSGQIGIGSLITGTNFAINLDTVGGSANIGAVIRGAASQSANLQQWQNSAGGTVASVDASGFGNFTRTSVGQSTDLNYGTLSVLQSGTAIVGAVVRQIASGTADLQQWQNSFGTNLGRMNTQGQFVAGGTVVTGNAMVNSAPYGNSQGGFATRMFLDSTANAFQIQNSAGVIQGGRNAIGQAFTGSFQPILSPVGGTIQSIATGINPIVTMASAHGLGVGDLVTLASTTGGTYDGTFSITAVTSTTFTIASALTAGQAGIAGTASVPAQKSITARSAGTKGLVVRSASGQTANLQEWQNSSGSTVLTRVASDGVVRATRYDTNNFYALLGEEVNGGFLTLTKATGALSSPSAGNARIYFRDGTVPTTLKLVVKAGATGAETTILDNIPT
jgi:hypothetical protein